MLRWFAIQRLLVGLIFCLCATIFADGGTAQPVGGPVTGGNDATGGASTGGNATGENVAGGNVGVNVGEERRFTITFKTFTVYDETGCDLCGSDEVVFIIRTSDYALRSTLYGNVDSPLFYRFDRCAQPAVDGDNDWDQEWECDQRGKAPPFSFTIAAWEDDGPRPFSDDCWQDQINVVDGRETDIYPPAESFCVELRGELIGKSKVELKLQDLSDLRSPGQFFYRDVDLIGGCDETIYTCGSSGGPHYSLRYEVKRLPDAAGGLPLNPNP